LLAGASDVAKVPPINFLMSLAQIAHLPWNTVAFKSSTLYPFSLLEVRRHCQY